LLLLAVTGWLDRREREALAYLIVYEQVFELVHAVDVVPPVRRRDPISRSAYAFCHGNRQAVMTSAMPMPPGVRQSSANAVSRSDRYAFSPAAATS
jgi:hypothetical protein